MRFHKCAFLSGSAFLKKPLESNCSPSLKREKFPQIKIMGQYKSDGWSRVVLLWCQRSTVQWIYEFTTLSRPRRLANPLNDDEPRHSKLHRKERMDDDAMRIICAMTFEEVHFDGFLGRTRIRLFVPRTWLAVKNNRK